MALFVNAIVTLLNAQKQLFVSAAVLQLFESMSSGFRSNRYAAGLQLSPRSAKQDQDINQAVQNANNPISLSQITLGALGEVTFLLQPIQLLAVPSQRAINSSVDRAALQNRFQLSLLHFSHFSANIASARSRNRDTIFAP